MNEDTRTRTVNLFSEERASFEKHLQRYLPVRNLTKVVRIGGNAERVELDRAMQLFLADAGFFRMTSI